MLRPLHVLLHLGLPGFLKVDITIDPHFAGEKTEDGKVVQWALTCTAKKGGKPGIPGWTTPK